MKTLTHILVRLSRLCKLFPSRSLFLIFAGSISAIGCAWSSLADHSVRFSELTGRAFYRLPPLPVAIEPKTGRELSTKEVDNYDYETGGTNDDSDPPEVGKEVTPEGVWAEVPSSLDANDLIKAKTLLEKYLAMTALKSPETSLGNDEELQQNRNSAYDMLDALTALKQGSSTKAVKAYLEARLSVTNSFLYAEQFDEIWKTAIADPNLRDNWEYLLDGQLVGINDNSESAKSAFEKHAVEFPKSEKHEAVLFMIARLTMRQSYSSNAKGCYIEKSKDEQEDIYYKPDQKAEMEPKEKCQDDAWHEAIKEFQQLIKKYPNGRYANDARGWVARLYLNGEEPALAVAEYYRLLGDKNDLAARLKAKKSLQIVGHKWKDETLDKVEELIADDPRASLAYAYHRIYNVAIDHSYESMNGWCCYGSNRWQQEQEEEKRVKGEIDAGNHELRRVAAFATRMLQRFPRSTVTGDFVLRTAEAQLELQNFRDALRLSDQALGLGITGDLRMEGMWVKGSSEHKLEQLTAARETFKKLISEFPGSKLSEGAKRLLAMTAEDQDDLETALDLYTDLKYDQDIAYFIDVLLPTDRLAKYVATRKNSAQYNHLLYALGVRYMRDKRWGDARETLRQVQTESGTDGYLQEDKRATWYFPKETLFDSEPVAYIKTSWVVQDLKTIDIIEYYEQAVENAKGDDAKAEAMYQLASCLFEADDLAMYNPASWQGGRAGALSQLEFSDHERLSNEAQAIVEHLQKHDLLAQSIPIYLEIASRFPKMKVAREALYSAAVAHERLSEHNGPWSAIYGRGMFAGPRLVTYQDVKSTFPDYQLPRGTSGWKPSSRTVNGGPAYAAPPKPAPKLTRTQRAERIFNKVSDLLEQRMVPVFKSVGEKYDAFWRSCIYALLTVVGVIFLGYASILGYYFWEKGRSMSLNQLDLLTMTDADETSLSLPDSDSRVAKFIDENISA